VTAFSIEGPYLLRVRFEDRAERLIDLRPVLAGELYGPLRDPAVFNQVRLDPEVDTLVWPNRADFDPATLYDWPQHAHAMAARAREWESAAANAGREERPASVEPRVSRGGSTER